MRLRVAGGALVAALLLLPAEASADHQIAQAVRASGKPLVTASSDQPVGAGGLVANLSSTPGSLELVGHSPLLNRGMNAALAVKGNYAYVGNRTDGTHVNPGVLVVDVSDPANPTVVNEIGPPLEGNPGESSRELRIWPEQDLLLVLNHGCSELIHRCVGGGTVRSTIRFYDISGENAAHPQLVSTFLPSRPRAGAA
jgi:LVIVD repeat-containing protein